MSGQTNTRRVELDGEEYDIPVSVLSRIHDEATLTVLRRRLIEDLTTIGDEEIDARLEAWWAEATGQERPADLIRSHADELLLAWDWHEDRQRSRLQLSPRFRGD